MWEIWGATLNLNQFTPSTHTTWKFFNSFYAQQVRYFHFPVVFWSTQPIFKSHTLSHLKLPALLDEWFNYSGVGRNRTFFACVAWHISNNHDKFLTFCSQTINPSLTTHTQTKHSCKDFLVCVSLPLLKPPVRPFSMKLSMYTAGHQPLHWTVERKQWWRLKHVPCLETHHGCCKASWQDILALGSLHINFRIKSFAKKSKKIKTVVISILLSPGAMHHT